MEHNLEKFNKAVSFLTPRVAGLLQNLPEEDKRRIQEVRLRAEKPLMLSAAAQALFLLPNGRVSGIFSENTVTCSAAELSDSFTRLCAYSVHSHKESINNGFVTVEGGHRAGICGTAVSEDGLVASIRDISSINLRIAGEYPGAADGLYESLFSRGLCSVILAGPPSSGKTTMLRDLACQLSGTRRAQFYRTVILDERGEIASVYRCTPQNDVGLNCDVLNCYPKAQGIQTALRCFAPELILCDEVGSPQELDAIRAGVHAGVCFAVSAHAATREDLLTRTQLRELYETRAFDYVVLLGGERTPCHICEIFAVKELCDAISGGNPAGGQLLPGGAAAGKPPARPCESA